MKRILGTILTIILLCQFCPLSNVQAKDILTKDNFDYDWYLQQHPDLAAIFTPDDHEAIWNFYQTTGEPAGWLGRKSKLSHINEGNFDYDAFLEQNPDVLACFGTDYYEIYNWYRTTGRAEGRIATTTDEVANTIMEMYDLADTFTNNSMSDREKVKAVHDWLCRNVAYDEENYYAGTIPTSSYSVEGAVKYGTAVCAGYASTFGEFMDILGIESEIIRGKATNSTGYTGAHVWNKVKVDGKWYWIDVTWDDPVPDRPGTVYRYDYFMISEEQMNRDHYPSK